MRVRPTAEARRRSAAVAAKGLECGLWVGHVSGDRDRKESGMSTAVMTLIVGMTSRKMYANAITLIALEKFGSS
jgi:hypothetical protein